MIEWNIGSPSFITIEEWVDSDFLCPDCKTGIMQKHINIVLTTNPPMYEYRCKDCGVVHYRFQ